MVRLEGKVSKVRFSTSVSGVDVTNTEQIAIFEISGKTVEFRSGESVIMEDGDRCVVAGELENGLFKALALNNCTKGIYSKNNAKGVQILGTIFTIVGIITIPVLIGIAFTYAGLKAIRKAKLIKDAHKIVMLNS